MVGIVTFPLEKREFGIKLLCVNTAFCIGCGLCAKVSPDDFVMINRKADVNKKIFKKQESQNNKLAIEKCPANAIKYM